MTPLPSDTELDQLFTRARACRVDTSAQEYAFETRLLARLQGSRSESSSWAYVSWRLIPFFAACVVMLALWQGEMVSQSHEAEQVAYLEGSDSPGTEFLN